LLNDILSSIPTAVPLLHCLAKFESQLSYDALFRSLRLVADRLGYPNVHIGAVEMDHCEAIRNAAQAGGTVGAVVRVVDCIVHVERNMRFYQNNLLVARGAADDKKKMKKKAKRPRATNRKRKSPIFLDAAREDAKSISAITDREIFKRGVEVVLADWRYHQLDAFADWFESVYLGDTWDNGAFFVGAGDRPDQCLNCNKPPTKRACPTIREMALEPDENLLSACML
jgi:hypothetical protein